MCLKWLFFYKHVVTLLPVINTYLSSVLYLCGEVCGVNTLEGVVTPAQREGARREGGGERKERKGREKEVF